MPDQVVALSQSPTHFEAWPIYCIKHKRKVQKMAIADWVNDTVVFIGYMKGGRFHPEGTGFFAAYEQDGKSFSHLVTAQHLLALIHKITKNDQVIVRINTPGETVLYEMQFNQFYFHPDEGRYVDVAVAMFPHKSEWKILAVNLSEDSATREFIKENSIGPGDEIFMAGYFRYHAGQFRNIPIVRTGNIAAFPDEPLQIRSVPMNAYLVEVRSIGGLSGSPVFTNLPAFRLIDGQAKVVQGGQRHYLLGLLKGHYDEDDEDLAESAGKIEGVNIGIGVVTPVEDIIETMKNPDLVELRKEMYESHEGRHTNFKEDSVSGSTNDAGDAEARRDEALGRMLNTPPKPRT